MFTIGSQKLCLRCLQRISLPGLWLGAAFVFSVLCIYSTLLQIGFSSRCEHLQTEKVIIKKSLENDWKAFQTVENDVILEYVSSVGLKLSGTEEEVGCANGSCSRVFLNGELYENPNITVDNCSQSIYEPSSITFQALPEKSEFVGFRIESKKYNLLSCDEIARFWDSSDFAKFILNKRKKEDTKMGIVVKSGKTSQFVSSSTFHRILTKEAASSTSGYHVLKKELMKRAQFGWNMKGIPHLLGACVLPTSIRLIFVYHKTSKLCKTVGKYSKEQNIEISSCAELRHFRLLLKVATDQTRALINFVKSFVCLFSELEERDMFLLDLHGYNFILQSDMSVLLDDLNKIFFNRNQENFHGKTICTQNIECLPPTGRGWDEGSFNYFLYMNCNDLHLCSEARCVGFNASVHHCGLANWLLSSLKESLTESEQRSRMFQLVNDLAVQDGRKRKSGRYFCSEVMDILQAHDSKTISDLSKPK